MSETAMLKLSGSETFKASVLPYVSTSLGSHRSVSHPNPNACKPSTMQRTETKEETQTEPQRPSKGKTEAEFRPEWS